MSDASGDSTRPAGRVRLLYIGGSPRSGSTILTNLLGSLPGFFSVGELRHIWRRGLLENQLCGCGSPIRECSFWQPVLESVTRRLRQLGLTPADVHRLQDRVVRLRHAPELLLGSRRRIWSSPARRAYREAVMVLYRSIVRVRDEPILVDSSKFPSDAALLSRIPELDVSFVRLVRDPRAVAHSWQRRKPRPDRHDQDRMVQWGPVYSTLNWLAFTLGMQTLARRLPADRSRTVIYEQFASDPDGTVAELARMVGQEPAVLARDGEGRVHLTTNHTVDGNPSRMANGPVEIREDDSWRRHLGLTDRLTVAAMAGPVMRRYGYPLLGARPGSPPGGGVAG